MPEEPSLASLRRIVRYQAWLIFGVIIMVLIAMFATLREVYRVEKKVDALAMKVNDTFAKTTVEKLEELQYGLKQATADFQKTAGDTMEKLTEVKVKKDLAGMSVIALTKWKKSGGKWLCIIDEVLRENPEMPFGLKRGDEFFPANEEVKEGNSMGTGVILFFKDSLYAMHEKAVDYWDYNEEGAPFRKRPYGSSPDLRIPDYDGMPVQRFKEIVAEQK